MRTRYTQPAEAAGLAPRRVAADIVLGVLHRRRPLDEQLDGAQVHPGLAPLADRDRALAHMLAATALRRLGSLRRLLSGFMRQGIPADAPRAEAALLIGAAQILWLDVPDHAAVDLSVRLVQADRYGAKYSGLVNAVLRRVAREGREAMAAIPPSADVPDWLLARWQAHYGAETAAAIAAAQSHPPSLDLTVKEDAEEWAARLNGKVLPTGSVRLVASGAVSRLPGFEKGAWWVQDAAASFPVRLLGDVAGKSVADLCAAPGGKTAQLAAAGAKVTAVERSAARAERLKANLARLKLSAEIVTADAIEWSGSGFDAVLVDAPCLSTGTIRRHPDIAWLKQESDLAPLVELQKCLLDRAVEAVAPDGLIVFCTCSLEPEEGEAQIEALLARNAAVSRVPVRPSELPQLTEAITPQGDLRTLPCHLPDPDPRFAGLDGFFAARLRRT